MGWDRWMNDGCRCVCRTTGARTGVNERLGAGGGGREVGSMRSKGLQSDLSESCVVASKFMWLKEGR